MIFQKNVFYVYSKVVMYFGPQFKIFFDLRKKGGKLALQGLVLRFLFVFNSLVSRINDLTSIFPTA